MHSDDVRVILASTGPRVLEGRPGLEVLMLPGNCGLCWNRDLFYSSVPAAVAYEAPFYEKQGREMHHCDSRPTATAYFDADPSALPALLAITSEAPVVTVDTLALVPSSSFGLPAAG